MKSRVSTEVVVSDWIEILIGLMVLNFVLFIVSCLLELRAINKESRRLDEILDRQRRAVGIGSPQPAPASNRLRR
jgi:hypothetical protein